MRAHKITATPEDLESMHMDQVIASSDEFDTEGHRYIRCAYTARSSRSYQPRGYEFRDGKYRYVQSFQGYGLGKRAHAWLYGDR